ncbi:MAG: hypothetical protein J5829_01820 [Lachnospiraceae bacterium]|nr:hypothetical protein [Lachnospiraceae bacterium]
MIRILLRKPYRTAVRAAVLLSSLLVLSSTQVFAAGSVPASAVRYMNNNNSVVDAFLSQSAFVGNSISVGLSLYNSRHDNVPLGNAKMLAKESYSFVNDFKSNTPYLPKVDGVPMRAKDAIKKSGARYVFICMGTNDLVGNSGAENATNNLKKYIAEITEANPGITIFMESCTPSRPTSNVINSKILEFNSNVKHFCDVSPNIYYIDIASPMSDPEGYLLADFASDGSCHLSNTAYASWVETVRSYISDFIDINGLTSFSRSPEKQTSGPKIDELVQKIEEMEQKKQILRSLHLSE